VVLNQVGQTAQPRIYNDELPAYVRAGGGVLAVHGAALLFRDTPDAEYNRMLGGYVDTVHAKNGHPTKHGAVFTVRLPEPAEPLVSAFRGAPAERKATHSALAGAQRTFYTVAIKPPVAFADELYALVRTPGQQTPPRVLLEIDKATAVQRYPDGSSDFTYALTWTKEYGKGRVYYTQFGHNMAVFALPCIAQSILDGLQYVAGDLAVK
jgi:type 1 glutamine amidotransferase